jgi:hypothetical protein
MKTLQAWIMGLICLLIPGCGNNSIDDYGNRKNKMDLRSFFEGNVEGWGAIFDYQGKQTRSFHVSIKGTWDKKKGRLEELFVFDDGEKTERIWDIDFSDDQKFIGKAKDVIGQAHGVQNGNAINLNYVLSIPYKDSTLNVNMDDWMYLVDPNIILNRTAMKKFGFKVGEVVLFMKKTS